MSNEMTVKLSVASKACGIDVTTLAMLLSDGQLGGSVRSSSGHVHLREDAIPNNAEVIAALEKGLTQRLGRAQRLLERVRIEIEAVGNDIALAIEDPHAELGEDLTTCHLSNRGTSTLSLALQRLERAAWDAQQYNEALRRAKVMRY